MDIDPQMTERISQKLKEKGVSIATETIESKLKLLTADFGIAPEEAEKMVTNELMREHGISGPSQQSSTDSQEAVPVSGLSPGDWTTIEGKVVSLSTPQSESIAQSGIIADESGAIRFVVWAKANAPPLEERRWYRLESATIDEYRGAPSMKIHSGTKVVPMDEEKTFMPSPVPVSELKPGVSTIRAKVVQDWEPRHERMFQSGILGDESGTVRFVTWKDDSSNTHLEEGKVYNIYYAGVDEFQGRLSLNLTGAMILEDEGSDITVASGNMKVSGAFVHMGGGTGLIKRCKVEGCNRALSRQNYCPVHEIQNDFRYDLRITGVVDDGQKATNVLIQREEAEKITGITLDMAREMAENNPLGFDDVVMKMQEALLGRYVECKGNDIDGTLLVKSCSLRNYDSSHHADLINRASASAPAGGDGL